MSTEVRVPTLGESVTEATVATWFKKPGDAVAVDEMLCELETDKVTVELPAPVSGKITKILKEQGNNASVGNIIGTIEEGNGPSPVDGAKTDTSSGPDTPVQTRVMPAAARQAATSNVDIHKVEATGPGGRVLKEDVIKK